jgi:hypothetical protein
MTNSPSTSTQYLTPDESADVDRALLSQSEKFLTRLTISSLRLLGVIAKESGVAIEDLSHQQVINWFEKDAKINREQGKEASTLQW